MNLDNDLKRLATAAATNWPEIALSGRLDTSAVPAILDSRRA
jgi:hypothetical protein